MVGAIRGGDVARLTRIPGIGKKTAKRMVLELRDKLPTMGTETVVAVPTLSAVEEDVVSALVNLGYQRAAAEKSLQSAVKTAKPPATFEVLFREALGAFEVSDVRSIAPLVPYEPQIQVAIFLARLRHIVYALPGSCWDSSRARSRTRCHSSRNRSI